MCSLYYNTTWKYTTASIGDRRYNSSFTGHWCCCGCCWRDWLRLLSTYLYTFCLVRFSSGAFFRLSFLLFRFSVIVAVSRSFYTENCDFFSWSNSRRCRRMIIPLWNIGVTRLRLPIPTARPFDVHSTTKNVHQLDTARKCRHNSFSI